MKPLHLLLLLLLVFLIEACIPESELYYPPQTRVLAINIVPEPPVSPGDTVTFTCIIQDSLDTRFRYEWSLSGYNGRRDSITEVNHIQWIAPQEPRRYIHRVIVDNGSDSTEVLKSFSLEVIINK